MLTCGGPSDAGEQFRLLGRELLIGQHPFLVQFRKSLKRSENILC